MAAWATIQIGLLIFAVLVVGRASIRRAAAGVLVTVSLVVPWFAPLAPLGRAVLCFVGLLAIVKTTQIGTSPEQWPAGRRIWHGLVPFDVRQVRLVKPAIDWPLLRTAALHGAICAGAFLALLAVGSIQAPGRVPARLLCGAVLVFAWVTASSDIVRLGHRLFGAAVPLIQRSPLLARTAGEFWGQRWNRPWSEWLRQFAFLPLARRRHGTIGILAAFSLSGVMHAWLVFVAVGASAAGLTATFFLVQGLFVVAESRFPIRSWHSSATHAWTLIVVLAPSPLFVAPMLKALGV